MVATAPETHIAAVPETAVASFTFSATAVTLQVHNGATRNGILSTKYSDDETDLVYYGYRYYSPEMGRWPSRDPIGEDGGENLYSFSLNAPGCFFEYLGLSSWLEEDQWHDVRIRLLKAKPHRKGQTYTVMQTRLSAGLKEAVGDRSVAVIKIEVQRPDSMREAWQQAVDSWPSGAPVSKDGLFYPNIMLMLGGLDAERIGGGKRYFLTSKERAELKVTGTQTRGEDVIPVNISSIAWDADGRPDANMVDQHKLRKLRKAWMEEEVSAAWITADVPVVCPETANLQVYLSYPHRGYYDLADEDGNAIKNPSLGHWKVKWEFHEASEFGPPKIMYVGQSPMP